MSRTVTLSGYAVLVALMIACELIARRTATVAPVTRALDALARWRPVWWIVLGGWLWIGWHVFVRAHH